MYVFADAQKTDIITGNINVRSVMLWSKTNKSNVFKFIPEDRKVGSCRIE